MNTQVIQNDFRGQIIYVGIDVHKKSWKVAIFWEGQMLKVFSQPPDPKVLVKHLRKHYPGAQFECGYEAGFCGFWVQEQLSALGLSCMVLHAADIPTTDKEKRQKTDARDCRKIAISIANSMVGGIHIPPKQLQHDRSVVRARLKISRDHTRTQNRIKGHIYFYGIELGKVPRYWSRNYIDRLWKWSKDQEDHTMALLLEELEMLRDLKLKALQVLRRLSRQPRYERVIKLLQSIPGMGLIHAMCFATEMGDIRRFKKLDQLCSMIGLIPTTHASGDKSGVGRITKRGKSEVKSTIIEAAWVAIGADKELRQSYIRLSQRMKKNRAIIRIAKKLVNRIRSVLLQGRPYVQA